MLADWAGPFHLKAQRLTPNAPQKLVPLEN